MLAAVCVLCLEILGSCPARKDNSDVTQRRHKELSKFRPGRIEGRANLERWEVGARWRPHLYHDDQPRMATLWLVACGSDFAAGPEEPRPGCDLYFCVGVEEAETKVMRRCHSTYLVLGRNSVAHGDSPRLQTPAAT